jgi:hypothetical protein
LGKAEFFLGAFLLKTNLIHHNLDVMHIKKNVFENIFNTMINMKGKTKDNMKVKMDMHLFYHYINIELIYGGLQNPNTTSNMPMIYFTIFLLFLF